jgi:biopolymer transport protein ExbD
MVHRSREAAAASSIARMKFHARPTRRRRAERITLNLASMIDVTFLLLIYFMLTTLLIPPEDRLSPTLQTQREGAAAAADFQPQIVEALLHEGRPTYRLGSRLLRTRDELSAAIEPLPRDRGVFVQVHGSVPVGFAVAAIQAARDAGFDPVTYVPRQP